MNLFDFSIFLLPIILSSLYIHRYFIYYRYIDCIFYHKSSKFTKVASYIFTSIFILSFISLSLSIIPLIFPGFLDPFSLLLIFVYLALILLDRYIFLNSAFYGLEDILFSAFSIFGLLVILEVRASLPNHVLSFSIGITYLFSIFVNAGFDKYKSND